jgi:hypothetical protein
MQFPLFNFVTQVPTDAMSLKLFSNQEYLIHYFAFLWKRTTSTIHMTNTIYKAQRAVEWLLATDGKGQLKKEEHLKKVHAMLGTLAKQFHSSFPHGKNAADKELPPPRPTKDKILPWQMQLKDTALRCIVDAGDQPLTKEGASLVAEWHLSEWLSNNIPPFRLACLRSMQFTKVGGEEDGCIKCQDDDCKTVGCKGNRLEIDEGDYYHHGQARVSLRPTPAELGYWDLLKSGAPAPPLQARPTATSSSTPSYNMPMGSHDTAFRAPPNRILMGDGMVWADRTPIGGTHTRWASDDSEDGFEDDYGGDDYDEDYGYEADHAMHEHEAGARVRTEWKEEGYLPDKLPMMRYSLVHHKEEDSWGPFTLKSEVPYPLAAATFLYLKFAHPILSMGATREGDFLFVKPETGEPLWRGEHLTVWWREIQTKHAAPWIHFPPNAFRDIHIEDRVRHLSQAVGMTGVNMRGDAALMQNTAGRVWETSYHKGARYYMEMAKGAIDMMTNFKHEVIKRQVFGTAALPFANVEEPEPKRRRMIADDDD